MNTPNKAQLLFSASVSLLLMVTGAALANNGITDWGLFWIGVLLSGVCLAALPRPTLKSIAAPVPVITRSR